MLKKKQVQNLLITDFLFTFAPAIWRKADMAQLVEQRIRNA